ncbi:MAG: hypothetical protein JXB50_02015 [Spirochaetes bacterium]|nr:hypothetical protein [Spirochaetota bacterium]
MNNVDIRRIEDFIKTLKEDELLYMNRLIIERVKLLSQQKSTAHMAKFNIGERVYFTDYENRLIKGTIFKLNKKTVSIKTDDNYKWNVSPSLIKHLDN